MNHILTLTKNSFKKNLKTLLSFSIILLLSSMLFSSALTIKNNFSKEYDKSFNELNTANTFFTIPKIEYNSNILENIKNIDCVNDVATRKGIKLTIPVKMQDTTQDQETIFYDLADNGKISKYDVVERSSSHQSNYIYLSNYTYINSTLKLNENFTFKYADKNYSFPVTGIIHEIQYGNYSSEILGQFLSSSAYNQLLKNNETKEVVTILVKSVDSYKAYQKISKLLNDQQITILNRNYDEQSKNSRLAIPNILVTILSVFSFVILIISLLVSKFKIENSIDEDMSNLGVLKALGYTSKEIMFASVLPYILSTLLFSIIGVSLSYLITPILANIIEIQTGFIWQVKVDFFSNSIVIIVNILLVTIFTVFAIRKIKRLNPINAIRGIEENKVVKNHFEIDKTKVGIGFNLALKNYSNSKSQNRLLGIVLFFITFVASFVGILFYNVNLYPKNFVDTLVEEYPNVAMLTSSDIKVATSKMNGVKSVIYYDENGSVTYKDNLIKVFVADDFKNIQNDICYEGKNPQSENEIAIGSKIKEQYNLKLNDYLEISKNENYKKYKVVGFIQSVNNSGEVFELTLAGYKKLDVTYSPRTLYVYLNNRVSAEEFIKEAEHNLGENIVTTINYDKSMEAAMDMYISLVSIICVVILVITILLIYLILYVLISSIITKKRQELGILKSLGYQNRQLILELVGGFLPSTIVGTVCGLLISKLSIPSIYKFLFKAVGAYKISFNYPITIFLIVTVLVMTSTFLIASLIAKKIKRISVYSLIKE